MKLSICVFNGEKVDAEFPHSQRTLAKLNLLMGVKTAGS